MEEQIIDVTAEEVSEEITADVSLHDDRIKSPAEIRKDLEQLRQLNKELKKIKKYMKSPLYAIRQMDARSSTN